MFIWIENCKLFEFEIYYKMIVCIDINIIIEFLKIKIEVDKLDCVVCGDKLIGKYYGVSICEGCKSFFKCIVWNSILYICCGNNNCIVDRDNWSCCLFCWF